MSKSKQKLQTPRFFLHFSHFCPIIAIFLSICLLKIITTEKERLFNSRFLNPMQNIDHLSAVFSNYPRILAISDIFAPTSSKNAPFKCPKTFRPWCFKILAAVCLKHRGGYVWGHFLVKTPLCLPRLACITTTFVDFLELSLFSLP